jgi:hypothetical protein
VGFPQGLPHHELVDGFESMALCLERCSTTWSESAKRRRKIITLQRRHVHILQEARRSQRRYSQGRVFYTKTERSNIGRPGMNRPAQKIQVIILLAKTWYVVDVSFVQH